MTQDIFIMGAGPAGMMAAITASQSGRPVTIFEHNEKLGKKLYLTGKGRCNLTNACPMAEFYEKIPANPRFLYSAFHQFSNGDLMDFFTQRGVPLTVEQGQRVFPASGKSSDILRVLERELDARQVQVRIQCGVAAVQTGGGKVLGITDAHGRVHACGALVIATGGITYPATGSTGDGYALARCAGHSIVAPEPALVPVEVAEPWAPALMGLSLRNVRMSVRQGKKMRMDEVGEMLFAHFGVTGPLILKATGLMGLRELMDSQVIIDLKPGLTAEQLDSRLARELAGSPRRPLGGALRTLLPQRLVPVVLQLAGLDGDTLASQVTRGQRLALGAALKAVKLTVTALRPPEEAVITRGGVRCAEVDPATMMSKKVEGLYFAGEVLDVHGLTGGYNMQIAFSTGVCAGNSLKYRT